MDMPHFLSNPLPTGEHLGSFYISAMMNNATMNFLCASLCVVLFYFSQVDTLVYT